MLVKLNLIILQVDNRSTYKCVHSDGIPTTILNIPIDTSIRNILSEYLNTDVKWIEYQLIDARGFDDTLHLYYACLIPSIIQLKKGQWKNVTQFNEQNQEIILEAIRRQFG